MIRFMLLLRAWYWEVNYYRVIVRHLYYTDDKITQHQNALEREHATNAYRSAIKDFKAGTILWVEE